MISVEDIERARRTPIADMLPRVIKLRRQGIDFIGPCPKCGGRDRFAISPKRGLWNCRGCRPADIAGDVVGLVMWLNRCSFREAVARLIGEAVTDTRTVSVGAVTLTTNNNEVVITMPAEPDDTDRITAALAWWRQSTAIDGTLAEVYLRLHREITKLPPDVDEVLRFHPRCIFGQDDQGQWLYRQCMLALYRDVITDHPTGVHRFGLNPDASLIGRMAMGRKQGSAVKLWGDAEVEHGLVVGEGVETVLAAATGITHNGTLLQPAWAMIDARNLADMPLLVHRQEEEEGGRRYIVHHPLIQSLTVLADHDEAKRNKQTGEIFYPGQEAADKCARRFAKAGIEACVLTPSLCGSDFNDFLKQIKAVP